MELYLAIKEKEIGGNVNKYNHSEKKFGGYLKS
jgi:hypothetical protein